MIHGYVAWLAWPPLAALVIYLAARRRVGLWYALGVLALVTYALWIVSVAFFPMPAERSPGPWHWWGVSLVPFCNLVDSFEHLSPRALLHQHGGNFLLLVPFTLVGPVLWPRLRAWKMALAIGLGASAVIELLQFCLSLIVGGFYRLVDIDDVILNTAGALAGYGLFVGGRAVFRRARRGAQAEIT